MGIISQIGRKDPKVRFLYFSIYAALTVGGLTMIYPFLLMISGSMKSEMDLKHWDAIPRFLRSDETLYQRHIEGVFNESLEEMNIAYYSDEYMFDRVQPPKDPNEALAAAWGEFIEQPGQPKYLYGIGYVEARESKTIPEVKRAFKEELKDKYGPSIEAVNDRLETNFDSWSWEFSRGARMSRTAQWREEYYNRYRYPVQEPLFMEFYDFKSQQPIYYRHYFSPEGFYLRQFLKTRWREIEEYNEDHGTDYDNWSEIRLYPSYPAEASEQVREDWREFVRDILNLLWVRAEPEAVSGYRQFLEAKYAGEIRTLNRIYETDYASFDEIPLYSTPEEGGAPLADWDSYIRGWTDPETSEKHQLPLEQVRLVTVETLFRDFLKEQYGSIASVNRALGTTYESFLDITPPQKPFHYLSFLDVRDHLKWEFASRNYKTVASYMLLHGRGIVNTAIYCFLAVLFALLVNPLAAYAMSRYQMPTTYKILLFLMLTMAFPPMVTQIPVFLMLRDLKLLNTFAALILPTMANGYMIFLLKGFFDSLPRELYESASIDGAGEWTMFWGITMNLSKPILAVIALQAFTIAYSNFMFALLICQDEQMWTLMVWLYQLRFNAEQAVVYASLIIAAIPTFIIFVFCQNIIMRGIVVPVEK